MRISLLNSYIFFSLSADRIIDIKVLIDNLVFGFTSALIILS